MKALNLTGVCQEQINLVSEFINNNGIECKTTDDENVFVLSDEDAVKIEDEPSFEWFDFAIKPLTYDVVFDDESASNSKDFGYSLEECKNYIKMYNGTNESYFENFKGGTVSIVCNETGEYVYNETIR